MQSFKYQNLDWRIAEQTCGAILQAGGELRSTAGWVPQCDIRSLSYFLLPIRQDQV
jgi:hypothetical protein